jgi:hypothetical protein
MCSDVGASILGFARNHDDSQPNMVLLGLDKHTEQWADCGGRIDDSDLVHADQYMKDIGKQYDSDHTKAPVHKGRGSKFKFSKTFVAGAAASSSTTSSQSTSDTHNYQSWRVIGAHTACREFVEETVGLVSGFEATNKCVDKLLAPNASSKSASKHVNYGRCDIVQNVFANRGMSSFIMHIVEIPYKPDLPAVFESYTSAGGDLLNPETDKDRQTSDSSLADSAPDVFAAKESTISASASASVSVDVFPDLLTSVVLSQAQMEKSELMWMPADRFVEAVNHCCQIQISKVEHASRLRSKTHSQSTLSTRQVDSAVSPSSSTSTSTAASGSTSNSSATSTSIRESDGNVNVNGNVQAESDMQDENIYSPVHFKFVPDSTLVTGVTEYPDSFNCEVDGYQLRPTFLSSLCIAARNRCLSHLLQQNDE